MAEYAETLRLWEIEKEKLLQSWSMLFVLIFISFFHSSDFILTITRQAFKCSTEKE